MNNKDEKFSSLPLRFVAQITLEATTALLIASGEDDEEIDKVFVRDVLGLPYLPATSIAGVLSHLYEAEGRKVDLVFGASSDSREGENSHASRLIISDGLIHDCANKPINQQIINMSKKTNNDPVLELAQMGYVREHVRIGENGTTFEGGKYNDLVTPTGLRFTFEIEMMSDGKNIDQWSNRWNKLLDLFQSQYFRLGSSTRSGYGAFKVIDIIEASFWLAQDKPDVSFLSFDDYCNHSRDLSKKPNGFVSRVLNTDNDKEFIILQSLSAPKTWLFGGGISADGEDIASIEEYVIEWHQSGNTIKGKLSENPILLIPGSSIKGAIVHRTLWHYRRLTNDFAQLNESDRSRKEEDFRPQEIIDLFGDLKESATDESNKIADTGKAGKVTFSDIFVPMRIEQKDINKETFYHVSIDRFTGGARNGFLFSEKVNLEANLGDYKIILAKDFNNIDAKAKEAFACTLKDIKNGWFSMGAGAGRGHGEFTCDEVVWENSIKQKEAAQ